MAVQERSIVPDWRVQFEKALYTVLYRLTGERVLVLGNSQVVRTFLDFKEVTMARVTKQLWQVRPGHAAPQLEKNLNQPDRTD